VNARKVLHSWDSLDPALLERSAYVEGGVHGFPPKNPLFALNPEQGSITCPSGVAAVQFPLLPKSAYDA